MSCISLKHHLPTIQQALLIYHTISETALHIIFNILNLTLEELKHALSKLYSILTFISRRDKNWGELFSESRHIFFYYASFMEFLLDKTRLREYWLEDCHYYTTLVTKILCFFKDLYIMNRISWDMLFFSGNISYCE